MKGFNNTNDIDGLIRESLKDFKEEPSHDLWDKMSNNLDKVQINNSVNPNPVNNPVNSIGSKIISAVSKSWFYYAAAASVATIGVIAAVTYFSLNSDEKAIDKQEAINNPNEKVIKENNLIEKEKINDKIYTPVINNSNNQAPEKAVDNNIILKDNQIQYTDNDKDENKSDQNVNKNDNEKPELNNQNIIVDQKKNDISPVKENEKKAELPIADNKKNKKKVVAKEESDPEVIEEEQNAPLVFNSDDQTESGDEFHLEIPNAFTPNGDGINDRFVIGKLNNVENPNLLVYDSRGKVVFKSTKYQNDWDANNAPDGTYYFFLQYVYKNKTEVKGGSIYVSR